MVASTSRRAARGWARARTRRSRRSRRPAWAWSLRESWSSRPTPQESELGRALFEEVAYGSDGELRSGTFLAYLIPSIGEVLTVQITHLVTPSTVHELGTKGAGEGGTIGGTAAIANAIADALSLHDVTLPLSPDRVVSLLR